MGPTNIALVKLFRADQALRKAQENYDTAARSVRLIERRVNDLSGKLTTLQQSLKEQQSKAANMELDLKTRDAHIEKLRTQQQQAKTNKEYQAFLTEINTEKVDRNKVEDETIKALEAVERTQGEVKTLQGQLDEEQKRLNETKAQLGGRLAELQTEIDRLRPARDEATAVEKRGPSSP
jgi:predicted  nucleic acid-binding Zn-ribbon protein